jgi:hypothetical protein
MWFLGALLIVSFPAWWLAAAICYFFEFYYLSAGLSLLGCVPLLLLGKIVEGRFGRRERHRGIASVSGEAPESTEFDAVSP